jgi:hypothetical protein
MELFPSSGESTGRNQFRQVHYKGPISIIELGVLPSHLFTGGWKLFQFPKHVHSEYYMVGQQSPETQLSEL